MAMDEAQGRALALLQALSQVPHAPGLDGAASAAQQLLRVLQSTTASVRTNPTCALFSAETSAATCLLCAGARAHAITRLTRRARAYARRRCPGPHPAQRAQKG